MRLPNRSEFIRTAVLTTSGPGVVRAKAFGFVQPGDDLTMWIRTDSRRADRGRVITRLGRNTITMETDYDETESGLHYVSRRVIRVPGDRVELAIENFDFVPRP